MRSIDAVIFDLGGVISRNGRPKDIASRYPGHDPEHVQRVLMGDYGTDTDHPWHRLERGEITLEQHRALTRDLLDAAGIEMPALSPPPAGSPAGSQSTSTAAPRRMTFERNEPVIELIVELGGLRSEGMRLAVLTNNIREFRPLWWDLLPFDEWFDDVVDSHEVGMRKPNPAIYELTAARLGVDPRRAAFLDDVETNLPPAAGLGMAAILVDEDPTAAVDEVRRLAGLAGLAGSGEPA
jgi:HAD superfamily hydrolase (TIGR01509 family)